VIRHDLGYFCPAPHLLPWCIKPRFEEILKGSPYWNAYQKQRASYLVDTALLYILNMLPTATAYTNLFYTLPSGEQAELDGLILFDRYALLIEGKAGSLGTARRAGPERIKTQLEALVGDAVDQVVRAHNYVISTDTPVFRLAEGPLITVDKTRFTQHVLITVTLDVLDIFTAEMYQMRDIGVVTTNPLPWSIALTDLRCVSEIVQRSFEFTHYLRWRLSIIEDASLSAGKDELNWLAVYLKEGPKLPVAPSGYSELQFTSYTDDFDAYFLYKEGYRTVPALRPAQPLPRPLDCLCDALSSQAAYGYTEVGECLLELNFAERDDLAQKLAEVSFLEAQGRATGFVLRGDSIVVKIIPGNVPKAQLEREAQAMRYKTHQRALVISLTTFPKWIVYNWAILPP